MLVDGDSYSPELEGSFHKTIKKVSEDIESLKYNTAIAQLMTLINEVYDQKRINRAELKTFLILLNPFAPHITEEIWESQGFGGMITDQVWPGWDEAKCKDDLVEIAVQVGGKIRARIQVAADIGREDALKAAAAVPQVAELLEGKTILKEIFVPGKLANFVAK